MLIRDGFEINIVSKIFLSMRSTTDRDANANRILGAQLLRNIRYERELCTKRRSSCAWAYEKLIKISFYSSKSAGFPSHRVARFDRSADRACRLQADTRWEHLFASVSPSLWNGLYLNLRARLVGTYTRPLSSADSRRTRLTHSHRRTFVTRLWTIALIGPGELLIAGARRIWLSIASFAERTFLISSGIPSVGLGLKSDAVFSTYFTHTRACTHVRRSIRVKASILVQTNEKIRLKSIYKRYDNTSLSFLFIF